MTNKTPTVELIPHLPEHLLALIESPSAYEHSFQRPPASGLREFLTSGEVPAEYLQMLRSATVPDVWTFGFAIIHPNGQVIGLASFKGPPSEEDVVEIAYAIVPEFQGHGYATEAAIALGEFATKSGQVKRLRAHTLPTPNASTRVLQKCGYQFVGEVVDPEDGPVWRWERSVENSQAVMASALAGG